MECGSFLRLKAKKLSSDSCLEANIVNMAIQKSEYLHYKNKIIQSTRSIVRSSYNKKKINKINVMSSFNNPIKLQQKVASIYLTMNI